MERINILNRFGSWTQDRPVFLMGDFNASPGREVYRTFVGDGNPNDTYFLKDCIEEGSEIDWILSKEMLKFSIMRT